MPKKHNLTDEKWRSPSIIEWETFGRVGDDSVGEGFAKTQDVPESMRIDDTGTYIYIGYAIPGSLTADNCWRLCRYDNYGNRLWADGDALYNNVWDNRASLSYS
jgi:hypothetical protein